MNSSTEYIEFNALKFDEFISRYMYCHSRSILEAIYNLNRGDGGNRGEGALLKVPLCCRYNVLRCDFYSSDYSVVTSENVNHGHLKF